MSSTRSVIILFFKGFPRESMHSSPENHILFTESFSCNIFFRVRNTYFRKRSLSFPQTVFFSFSIYFQRSTIVRLQTFFCFFSVYSFSQVWPVNLMKLSIHGLLEKIRFHINQVFENFVKTFTHFFFLFSPQKSISYLHTNSLTVIDTERQRENLFSY